MPGIGPLTPSSAPERITYTAPASAPETAQASGCETCKNRTYQDGSNDPGVSFKTPTHVAPEQAASAVAGHEREHVVREQGKAERSGREVVSQSVQLHSSVCPECGRAYISGGTTRTVTREKQQDAAPAPGEPGQILDRYR